MSGKASTIVRVQLLTCQHQKTACTIEHRRPTGAENPPPKGVDAKRLCRQAAIVRLGHQPGIGDEAGKSIPPGAGFGTVCRCQDFGRQSRRPVPAQPARQGQRACAALPRQTLTRPGSADGLKFTVQSIFSALGKNNCRSNTAYKKVSPAAKP